MKTVAIIPALNEFERLQAVIEETVNFVDHVIVVDDGSSQPIEQQIRLAGRVTVLRHIINLGKGAALKTGLLWAKQQGFEIVIFLDADGQHNPNEIPHLLKPILENQAKIVFGVRSFNKKMPLISLLGNIVLSRAVQLLYRIRVDDTQSGYRAMLISTYEKINWESARYAVETEMIVNAGKHKIQYAQIPISTIYHDKYKGSTVFDGLRILLNMVIWRFK